MFTPAIRAMIYLVSSLGPIGLALPLLVARVRRADHPHDAVAPDDLAVAADLLHRCQYLHFTPSLFRAERDPGARQVVRRQLDGDLVSRKNLDVVHAHLSRDMRQHDMTVFELYAK